MAVWEKKKKLTECANWSPPSSSSPLMIWSGNNPSQKWKSDAQQNWSWSLRVMRHVLKITFLNFFLDFACDAACAQKSKWKLHPCGVWHCTNSFQLALIRCKMILNYVLFRMDSPRLFDDSHVGPVSSNSQIFAFSHCINSLCVGHRRTTLYIFHSSIYFTSSWNWTRFLSK